MHEDYRQEARCPILAFQDPGQGDALAMYNLVSPLAVLFDIIKHLIIIMNEDDLSI